MDTSKPVNRIEWISSAGIPLLRVKPGPDMAVIVAGPLVSYYVHWMADLARTQPCYLFGCAACDDATQRRPMSYIGVMHWRVYADKAQWLPGILEVPYRAGQTIGQMIGKRIALNRSRKCGGVNIGTYLFDMDQVKVSPVPFVDQLMTLWRVPRGKQLALVGNLGPTND